MRIPTWPGPQGRRRLVAADRGLLAGRVEGRPEDELTALYKVDGRPLGDACESLRDLVAHVLMWDEINLAVLTEMTRHDEESWRAGPGAVVQRAMTVSGRQPYRHAAFHLGAALPTP